MWNKNIHKLNLNLNKWFLKWNNEINQRINTLITPWLMMIIMTIIKEIIISYQYILYIITHLTLCSQVSSTLYFHGLQHSARHLIYSSIKICLIFFNARCLSPSLCLRLWHHWSACFLGPKAIEWRLVHIRGLSCSDPLDHGKKGAVKGPLSLLQSQEQAMAG